MFLLLIAAAWLVPNHYAPWTSAWSEAVAISVLLMFALRTNASTSSGGAVSLRLLGVAVLSISMVTLQLITGKEGFFGDAVMVFLYVSLWVMAALAGRHLATTSTSTDMKTGLDTLEIALLFGAVLSVGVALIQWTGAFSLGIYGAELPPGGRPFGNVAQPNHLCTICFLGLCGLFWLHQQRRVHDAVFWLGATFLLLGMVMTQSRTGWLQIGLLIAWALVMRVRAGLRISRRQLLVLGGLFATGVAFWPVVCDFLLLSPGRSIGDQMQAGIPLPYWLSMLDAIG